MKKILILFLFILLVIYIWNSYSEYKRYNPSSEYDYSVNDSIDKMYHNHVKILQYYRNVEEIGSLWRYWWYQEKQDIRYVDIKDPEARNMVNRYNQLVAHTKHLEDQLLFSSAIKAQGGDNDAVKYLEDRGGTYDDYLKHLKEKELMKYVGLKYGDENEQVFLLQKKLADLDYAINTDGVFKDETKRAILRFQKDNQLFVSEVTTKQMVQVLMSK